MSDALSQLTWPASRLVELLDALARRAGVASGSREPLGVSDGVDLLVRAEADGFARAMSAYAARAGLEAEPVSTPYGDLEQFVKTAGPCIVRLPAGGLLPILAPRYGKVRVLAPDRATVRVSPRAVARALAEPLEHPVLAEIERSLTDAGVSGARRDRARKALLLELLRAHPVRGAWMIRLAPGASLRRKLAEAGVPRLVWGLIGAYVAEYSCSGWCGFAEGDGTALAKLHPAQAAGFCRHRGRSEI